MSTCAPIGLPALANRRNREGLETEILQPGVKRIRAPAWSAIEEVAASKASMIGADPRGHDQTFGIGRRWPPPS